jgi:DNA (cytosine-5)-methyltransferase 1
MKFISLFSGVGGFDLGLERANMQCVAQVEINKAARGVLATHYPHVERLEDVTTAGKHNLPTVDLICGGSPCQDLSMAGKRAGLDGTKSRLFFEFVRILDEVKPTWFVFENVEGLLIGNEGRDFATVLFCLGECGYRLAWRVLDAQYFGTAQQRKRVFIVGHLRNAAAASVLFDADTPQFLGTPQERLVSPTLIQRQVGRGGGNWAGGLVIQDSVGFRQLTPIECERLQGLPDNWTLKSNEVIQHNATRYRQLGNAVAVPVIEWIGKRIMANA